MFSIYIFDNHRIIKFISSSYYEYVLQTGIIGLVIIIIFMLLNHLTKNYLSAYTFIYKHSLQCE